MVNSYPKGYRFEHEFVKLLRKGGFLADRFHKSVGPFWKTEEQQKKYSPFDVWSVDPKGIFRLYQCKNDTKPRTEEMLDMLEFSLEYSHIPAYLVTRYKRKIYVLRL